MMTSFHGRINARPAYKAIEIWRPQSMMKRGQRLTADGVARPCLWKWTVRSEDEMAVGFVTLSTHAHRFDGNPRCFGPKLNLFIRPAYRGLGYGLGVTKGLIQWVKTNKLYKILHASHRADDFACADRLIAAKFLYTGCRTVDVPERGPSMLVHHMIMIL